MGRSRVHDWRTGEAGEAGCDIFELVRFGPRKVVVLGNPAPGNSDRAGYRPCVPGCFIIFIAHTLNLRSAPLPYLTMISLDFKNKLVLVTGGGRGIGLEITRAIAEGKHQLFLSSGALTISSVLSSWSGSGNHIHFEGLLRPSAYTLPGIPGQG